MAMQRNLNSMMVRLAFWTDQVTEDFIEHEQTANMIRKRDTGYLTKRSRGGTLLTRTIGVILALNGVALLIMAISLARFALRRRANERCALSVAILYPLVFGVVGTLCLLLAAIVLAGKSPVPTRLDVRGETARPDGKTTQDPGAVRKQKRRSDRQCAFYG